MTTDRNLGDLIPIEGEHMLRHAMSYVALTRPCYPEDEGQWAIEILWNAIQQIMEEIRQ